MVYYFDIRFVNTDSSYHSLHDAIEHFLEITLIIYEHILQILFLSSVWLLVFPDLWKTTVVNRLLKKPG